MQNATSGFKNKSAPTLGNFRDADVAAAAAGVDVAVVLVTWWLETAFSDNPRNNQGHYGPLQIETLGNIVRFSHGRYGNWRDVAYWYGPGSEEMPRVYANHVMSAFPKFQEFFKCMGE